MRSKYFQEQNRISRKFTRYTDIYVDQKLAQKYCLHDLEWYFKNGQKETNSQVRQFSGIKICQEISFKVCVDY